MAATIPLSQPFYMTDFENHEGAIDGKKVH